MCSIIGFFNFEDSLSKTIDSMSRINYRGQDACGVYDGKNIKLANKPQELKTLFSNLSSPNSIGHLLHSIVDFVPQPLKGEGILIANCEIYNWEELKQRYMISAKSDSELLLQLLDKFGLKILDELDGPYAFAYLRDKKLVLARDILGVKPLFYHYENKRFCFASEKKVLPKDACELNPRNIFIYDMTTNNYTLKQRSFYELKEEHDLAYPKIKNNVEKLLFDAIKKRIPKNQKIGVLFSGGVDSTIIAYILKRLGIDFTCYTAKINGGKIKEAKDLIYAKEIAKKYDLKLKVAHITTEELEPVVKDVVELIEDRDYIKVSVALPFYLACQKANEDGVKVIFSGLGSEEIFAGYRRHKKSQDPNKECLEGLKILHARDLYRDDVITMKNNLEMRSPFLDKELINYSLNIPAKFKISEDKVRSKIVLRDVAKDIGLDEKFAERQKQAAQYGSKFDKGMHRLAKDNRMTKQDYLNSLKIENVPLCEFRGNLG